MLARFNIILATDEEGGIGLNNDLPWDPIHDDMIFFKKTTVGNRRNAVIMGKNTWDSIPEESRPLKDRINVIISKTLDYKTVNGNFTIVCQSMEEALLVLGERLIKKELESVFVMGGETIYNLVLKDYLYLCDYIFHTKIKGKFKHDRKVDIKKITSFPRKGDPSVCSLFTRSVYECKVVHSEYAYLSAARTIMEKGDVTKDRTGTGTKSVFGTVLNFDLSDGILPVITTKKMSIKTIVRELLWFISGSTDSKILETKNVNIWKANSSIDFLAQRGLDYREGDIGPGYGFQWRHSGAEYKGCDEDYKNQGIDQLQNVIESIKQDPYSRRHIISAWNVSDIKKMALPPCHMDFQFKVSECDARPEFLDCIVHMRSADVFLGLPYNITSYAILTHMVGTLTRLKPRRLIFMLGDTHIYLNHIDQVKTQLTRTPYPFPRIRFDKPYSIKNIDEFVEDNIIIDGYISHRPLKGVMSV